jgi:hypothetical protein
MAVPWPLHGESRRPSAVGAGSGGGKGAAGDPGRLALLEQGGDALAGLLGAEPVERQLPHAAQVVGHAVAGQLAEQELGGSQRPGGPRASWSTSSSTVRSSSSASTARSSSPTSRARVPSNGAPVRNSSRAAWRSMRRRHVTAMMAGATPMRTSLKPKVASASPTARSQAAIRPRPPARATPLTRATTGRGRLQDRGQDVREADDGWRPARSLLLQVCARAERRLGPGEHDDPDAVLGERPEERRVQLRQQGPGQRVAVVRTVQGDHGRRPAPRDLDQPAVVSHGTAPAGPPSGSSRSPSWAGPGRRAPAWGPGTRRAPPGTARPGARPARRRRPEGPPVPRWR